MTHQDRNYAEDRQNHGSDPECIKIAREALKAIGGGGEGGRG